MANLGPSGSRSPGAGLPIRPASATNLCKLYKHPHEGALSDTALFDTLRLGHPHRSHRNSDESTDSADTSFSTVPTANTADADISLSTLASSVEELQLHRRRAASPSTTSDGGLGSLDETNKGSSVTASKEPPQGLSRRDRRRAFMKKILRPCRDEEVVSRAFKIYDFGEPDNKQQAAVEEMVKIFGLQDVPWPEDVRKGACLPSKLFNSVNAIARRYGFVSFDFEPNHGKGLKPVLSIEPSARKLPKPPSWLEHVEIERIKLGHFHNDVLNERFESGASLSESDPVRPDFVARGSLGCIMSNTTHDPESPQPVERFFVLTANHVFPDGATQMICQSTRENIKLSIVRRFQRLVGHPSYGCSEETFANEVGLLEISPQSISSFVYQIANVDPFYFSPNPPMRDWEFQDVLFEPRRKDLNIVLDSRSIPVFKIGHSTDLTMGHFRRTMSIPKANRVYYEKNSSSSSPDSDQVGSNLDQDGNDSDEDGSDKDEDGSDEDQSGGDKDQDESDEDFQWVGIVAWDELPFAIGGDSGSLVYAFENGVRVPLGIHIGSDSDKRVSYFLSLDAFAVTAEEEGLALYFPFM